MKHTILCVAVIQQLVKALNHLTIAWRVLRACCIRIGCVFKSRIAKRSADVYLFYHVFHWFSLSKTKLGQSSLKPKQGQSSVSNPKIAAKEGLFDLDTQSVVESLTEALGLRRSTR